MDCKEAIGDGAERKFGSLFKCCDCHSSYRYCRDHMEGWSKMSHEVRSIGVCFLNQLGHLFCHHWSGKASQHSGKQGQGRKGKEKNIGLFNSGQGLEIHTIITAIIIISLLDAEVQVEDFKSARGDVPHLNETRQWGN